MPDKYMKKVLDLRKTFIASSLIFVRWYDALEDFFYGTVYTWCWTPRNNIDMHSHEGGSVS